VNTTAGSKAEVSAVGLSLVETRIMRPAVASTRTGVGKGIHQGYEQEEERTPIHD
jgi:hypothetical protein